MRFAKPINLSATLRFPLLAIALGAALIAGCGPRPVVGGTSGVLLAGGEPLADMQLTVYENQLGTWEAIGFADTAADGTFKLLLNEARGPLQLAPGSYRFTLQSVGAPLLVPQQLAQVDTTTLQTEWTGNDTELKLTLPSKLAQRR